MPKKMTKEQFVRQMMSDMATRRRIKRNKEKFKEAIVMGHIMNNHFRIAKYQREIKG